MKIDSWKKSMQSGFVFGVITYALLAIFTTVVYYMCGKENFIAEESMREAISGIPFMNVNVVGAVIAALVPFFELHYDSVKYVPLSLLSAAVIYLFLFFISLVVPEVIFGGLNYPLETLDAKFYATMTFPLGTFVGTVWSVVFKSIVKVNK